MKNLGDITMIDGTAVPIPSVVIGGSPCQDLSVAGKRAGLAGARSGLFMEQIRLIKEMRSHGRTDKDGYIIPRYMVWENVPGALSSNGGEDFRAVLEETCRVADETVYVPRPPKKWGGTGVIMGESYSVAWRIVDAQYWGKSVLDRDTGDVLEMGTPQRRRRIALVADFGARTAPERLFDEVLAQSESVSGDTESGGEERQGAAGDAPEGAGEAVSFQERAGKPGGVKGYSSSASASEPCQPSTTKPCLTSEEKLQIDEWISAVNAEAEHQQDLIQTDMGAARALAPGTHAGGSHLTKTLVTYPIEGNGARPSHQGDGWSEEDVSYTLNAVERHGVAVGIDAYNQNITGDQSMTLQACRSDYDHVPVVSYGMDRASYNQGRNAQYDFTVAEEVMPTMATKGPNAVSTVYDARGNGDGEICPTMTGDHEGHVSDYTAIVLNDQGGQQMSVTEDVTNTLRANTKHHEPIVSTHAWDGTDVSPTLTARNAGGGQRMPDKNIFTAVLDDKLTHRDIQEAVAGNVVRRLTPRECERLQGFPDDYTDIGEWIDSRGRTRTCADSLRYKALGNSICLPFWRWLLKRIADGCAEKTMASLFDGIGGFPLCWHEAGGVTLWTSEIDEFCNAVTSIRF